jgi:hypothetical protein
MTTPERKLVNVTTDDSLQEQMRGLGVAAREAADLLGRADADSKNAALRGAAAILRESADEILRANEIDLANGHERGLSAAMLDHSARSCASGRHRNYLRESPERDRRCRRTVSEER